MMIAMRTVSMSSRRNEMAFRLPDCGGDSAAARSVGLVIGLSLEHLSVLPSGALYFLGVLHANRAEMMTDNSRL